MLLEMYFIVCLIEKPNFCVEDSRHIYDTFKGTEICLEHLEDEHNIWYREEYKKHPHTFVRGMVCRDLTDMT